MNRHSAVHVAAAEGCAEVRRDSICACVVGKLVRHCDSGYIVGFIPAGFYTPYSKVNIAARLTISEFKATLAKVEAIFHPAKEVLSLSANLRSWIQREEVFARCLRYLQT